MEAGSYTMLSVVAGSHVLFMVAQVRAHSIWTRASPRDWKQFGLKCSGLFRTEKILNILRMFPLVQHAGSDSLRNCHKLVFQILTNIWLSDWSNDDPYDENGVYDRGQADYRLGVYGGLGALQGTDPFVFSPPVSEESQLWRSWPGARTKTAPSGSGHSWQFNVLYCSAVRSWRSLCSCLWVFPRFQSPAWTYPQGCDESSDELLWHHSTWTNNEQVLLYQLLSRILCGLSSWARIARVVHLTYINRNHLLSRFSKDMDVLDANMPLYIRMWLFALAPVLTTMILICYSTPIFAVVVVPVAILFVIAQVKTLILKFFPSCLPFWAMKHTTWKEKVFLTNLSEKNLVSIVK